METRTEALSLCVSVFPGANCNAKNALDDEVAASRPFKDQFRLQEIVDRLRIGLAAG